MFRKTMIRFCIWYLERVEKPSELTVEEANAYGYAVEAFNNESLSGMVVMSDEKFLSNSIGDRGGL